LVGCPTVLSAWNAFARPAPNSLSRPRLPRSCAVVIKAERTAFEDGHHGPAPAREHVCRVGLDLVQRVLQPGRRQPGPGLVPIEVVGLRVVDGRIRSQRRNYRAHRPAIEDAQAHNAQIEQGQIEPFDEFERIVSRNILLQSCAAELAAVNRTSSGNCWTARSSRASGLGRAESGALRLAASSSALRAASARSSSARLSSQTRCMTVRHCCSVEHSRVVTTRG
jgi:hypothetical protein